MSTTQIVSSQSATTMGVNVTRYICAAEGSGVPTASEAPVSVPFRNNGLISHLTIRINVNTHTSSTTTFRIRKNGVDGSQTVSVGAGQTGVFQNTTVKDTISSGDLVVIKAVTSNSGSGAITLGYASFLWTVASKSSKIYASNSGVSSSTSGGTLYQNYVGVSQSVATEAETKLEFNGSFTVRNYFVYLTANARTTTTTFGSRKNGGAGAMSVAVTAGQTGLFEDTTNSDSMSSGNEGNLYRTNGASAESYTRDLTGVAIESSGLESIFIAGTVQGLSTSANSLQYLYIAGYSPFGTTEAIRQVSSLQTMNLSNMSMVVTTNGKDATTTVRLRKNGSNGNQTFSISAGATGKFEDTSNTDSIQKGDLINYSVDLSGSTTGTFTVTLAHFKSTFVDTLSISVNDALTITEDKSVARVIPPLEIPPKNDSVILSEAISIFRIDNGIHVFLGGLDDSDDITLSVQADSLSVNNILTSQVDSCNFTVKKYGTSHTTEPVVGQEVFIFVDGIREFAGIITRVTQRAEDYKIILFDVQCEDYTRLLNKKLVTGIFENQTLGFILDKINRQYLNGFTLLTVDDAETVITYISFNYENVASCLTKLATLLNFDWYVDYHRNIHFISKTSQIAPFNLADDSDTYIFDSFRIRRDNSQVRNRIFVAGGEYLGDTFTTEFVSDGFQNIYTLPYKYEEIFVSVTGEPWDGGIDTIDPQSLHDYLWNKDEKFIRFRGDRVPNLASGIRISGEPYLPVRVVVQDNESIADFITAEGGDGIYEHIIVDDTINSQEGARERASAELESYKATLSEGSFMTKKAGLRSGQRISIVSEAHSITETFLINAVRLRMKNNREVRYEVSLVTTKTLGIIEFLQGLLKATKAVKIQQGDIIDLIKSNAEIATINETVTAQSLNYPVQFVAGPLASPTGFKRVFITNGSPLARHMAPQFHEHVTIRESLSVVRT